MSQQQPRRPETEQFQREPIKYGDVFLVSGDLADKPIAPQDAAMTQSAENMVMGRTQKGGAASVMQSAASRNERSGVVGHTDLTDVAGDEGVTFTEADVPGRPVITESVAGQLIGQYTEPRPVQTALVAGNVTAGDAITIGEALEATVLTAGDKAVDQSDAAAIEAAEVRATVRNVITPRGVAAAAQSAATRNARIMRYEVKTKLADVLTDPSSKLPVDKAATQQDAEGVVGGELRNNPNMAIYPGGVAASVAAAAKLNQIYQ